ncbi:MAG: GyrI-like domain-containing protein [Saprospiraceae bacterium]
MEPRIEILEEKKLIGIRIKMSFIENRTKDLWQSFMPRRKEVKNINGPELYSVEVYSSNFFDNFNPNLEFEKWAAIEVSYFEYLPEGMETLIFPKGQYAVFIHKGPASKGAKTYEYIFRSWLPGSSFNLDHRPHFAVMGEKYNHEEEDSEEEIWIPIKSKLATNE